MEQQNKKVTPRRLGLSRISPRIQKTPQNACTNDENNAKRAASPSKSKATDDIDSMVTPIKQRKITYGRLSFTPEEQKNEMVHESSNAKTDAELQAEIQQMREHLAKYEKYKNEKKELEQLIEMWRAGGNQALRQLQAEIQPKQEIEMILEHFQLPVNIFGDMTE